MTLNKTKFCNRLRELGYSYRLSCNGDILGGTGFDNYGGMLNAFLITFENPACHIMMNDRYLLYVDLDKIIEKLSENSPLPPF